MTLAAGLPLRASIVTSSYRGDLERCRLLCDSIDRYVSGIERHYILVEEADRALFAPLEGPRRRIVGEREILPGWLRPVRDPISRGRRLWLHPFGLPLRGWHVQQLRRIAMAMRMEEEVMISCDSDVVIVKPVDLSAFSQGPGVRFYRVADGLDHVDDAFRADHDSWARRAARLLGIDEPREIRTGYITTALAWRTDTVRDMAARIEQVTGRAAMQALAATRALSECIVYGRFVDEVENRPDRHLPTDASACRVYWTGAAMTREELARLIGDLSENQIAICVQSFTRTDPALIRSAAKLD